MRLTFRLKDAEMQIRGGNHLQAKFDLASIRNKVISQNTRLYVEAVDTCDFRLVGGEDSGRAPYRLMIRLYFTHI